MAAYVDYTYYTTTFLGTAIASADFARLALRASEQIDALTFDRAAPIVTAATDTATIDLIKKAACAVAEQYQTNERAGNSDGIAAESVGSTSVTYANNASARLTNTAKLQNAATPYLGSTGLLFRGFSSGEYSGETDAD